MPRHTPEIEPASTPGPLPDSAPANTSRDAVVRDLRLRIATVPRVRLGEFPTPLTELARLSRHLGGPRLFMKREDLSGLALGGNKTRLLEFRLAEARGLNADVVIAGLEEESNSARQLTAAANHLGLRTVLVLRSDRTPSWQGNLLLDDILGAEIHFVPSGHDMDTAMRHRADEERRCGRMPYVMNHARLFGPGAALAGLEWTLETVDQMQGLGLAPTHFYLSSGGKCQSGMVLAEQMLGGAFRVVGVHAKPEPTGPDAAARIANATAPLLGLDISVRAEAVENRVEFAGAGFGVTTAGAVDAIRLVARLEGILLDPVFTGKAMACLIADIESRRLGPADVAVFIHTGGIPALFARAHELTGSAAMATGGRLDG